MAQVVAEPAVLDTEGLSTRAINQQIKQMLADGVTGIEELRRSAKYLARKMSA